MAAFSFTTLFDDKKIKRIYFRNNKSAAEKRLRSTMHGEKASEGIFSCGIYSRKGLHNLIKVIRLYRIIPPNGDKSEGYITKHLFF